MLRSGLPLPSALAFLADGLRERDRGRLLEVQRRLELGEPLSGALEALPRAWAPPALRAAVAGGEQSGRLPDVLEELAREGERIDQLTRRARAVLLYPLTVLAFAALVLHAAMWKTVPVSASLFRSLGAELPLGTRLIAGAWELIGVPLTILLVLLALNEALGLFSPASGVPWLHRGLARLARLLPPVRSLERALAEVRFCRTLRLMLLAGVPLPQVLERCAEVVDQKALRRQLLAAADQVAAGEAPSRALQRIDLVTPSFLALLAGSERRGDFLEVTCAMGEAAEEQLAARIEVFERMLEPTAIVAIGLVIGFVVVHLYWPMFELTMRMP